MYKFNKKDQAALDSRKTFFILFGIFTIYFLLSSVAINGKLSAPGEMWILYVADRITDGLIPYQDITITYGPFVYIFNAIFLKFGLPYTFLKMIMLMVSISNGILVYFATEKIFKKKSMGILASAIYMFIPLHYGMGPVIHLDQLAVLQSLLILNLILIEKKISTCLGGIVGAIIYTTKVIAIPLSFGPIIYFLINRKKELIYYTLPLGISLFGIYSYISSIKKYDLTEFFMDYVLKNPDTPYEHLRSFVWIEGLVVIFGIIGLIIFIKKYSIKSILVIMSLTSIFPFFAFMIRGTGIYSANYIEPYISIFAAFSIFYIYEKLKIKISKRKATAICIIIILLIFIQFTIFDLPNRERIADWRGDRSYEYLNEIITFHSKLIETHTNEKDIVVAMPMSAFQTNRILALDEEPYSDILKIKKELFDYNSTKITMNKLKIMLENKEISIIIEGNSTVRSELEKLNYELLFYYPFNEIEFKKIIDLNYNKFFESGYHYYLPNNIENISEND